MDKYVPRMYKKDIYSINYDKLKEKGIKCLIYDLDNPLLEVNTSIPEDKTCKLIGKLKKDFDIYIISNNSSEDRAKTAAKTLGVEFVHFAMKPFGKGFRFAAPFHFEGKATDQPGPEDRRSPDDNG